MFWNPETTTGGNALKFYASQRLDIRRKEKLESGTGDDKEAYGNKVKVKVVKNKIAPPFREVEIDVLFNEGISHAGELLDIGAARGIIKKAGAFYSYGETRLGQGRENARDFLKANEKMMQEIDKEVRKEKAERVESGKKKWKEEKKDEILDENDE